MTYADFLRRAAELKVDGVSLETCFFESLDDAYLKGLKEIIDDGGMEPVIAWGHPKGFEGGKAPQAMADLQKMFRVCHILGAKVMRVVGSSLDYRNDPHEPQLEALTGIFKEAARVAEGEGVKLAMENHFDFTTDEFLDLVDRVNSPYFGVCFDTGNACASGMTRWSRRACWASTSSRPTPRMSSRFTASAPRNGISSPASRLGKV